MLDYGHRTFLFQVFEVALTVKTIKSDEKPKVNFAYSWNCYPFLRPYPGIKPYYTESKKPRKNEEVDVLQAEGIWGKRGQISIYIDKVWWHHLVILCWAQRSFDCQSLLPSGCLCTFLDIWKLQSHPPFSYKTDPRPLRERADIFLLNCNWTELKIDAELKLKCTECPCCACAASSTIMEAKERGNFKHQRCVIKAGVTHDDRCMAHVACRWWLAYFRDGLGCFIGGEGDSIFYLSP